jgi:hypothetical protein
VPPPGRSSRRSYDSCILYLRSQRLLRRCQGAQKRITGTLGALAGSILCIFPDLSNLNASEFGKAVTPTRRIVRKSTERRVRTAHARQCVGKISVAVLTSTPMADCRGPKPAWTRPEDVLMPLRPNRPGTSCRRPGRVRRPRRCRSEIQCWSPAMTCRRCDPCQRRRGRRRRAPTSSRQHF